MTPPPFAEFESINEALLQVAGELRGLVAAAEALPRQIAKLDLLVARALDQTETVTRHAAALAAKAQRDVAAVTADRAARHAEIAALREQARQALR
jgi:hypothetical protein